MFLSQQIITVNELWGNICNIYLFTFSNHVIYAEVPNNHDYQINV